MSENVCTSSSSFDLVGDQLVVTRRYSFPPKVARFMQALADAQDDTLESVIHEWFELYLLDHPGRDEKLVPAAIKDWAGSNQWELASWIISSALGRYGDWEICDTEQEFAEQVKDFFYEDSLPDECRAELQLAVDCALVMDGKGARLHSHAAAKFWWKEP